MPVLVCLFISWDIGIYKSRRDVVSAAFLVHYCTVILEMKDGAYEPISPADILSM
jgi:hypothetical protein